MIKDGKYRYTLQFGMDTEEERRAGTFLERLGNRKSPFIVAAINELLQNHPELYEDQPEVHFTVSGIDPRMLETKIRQIIDERLGISNPVSLQPNICTPGTVKQVSDDILDMLNDLECFE